jgi:hypothetical protein
MSGLQGYIVCKIVIPKELLLNSSIQKTYVFFLSFNGKSPGDGRGFSDLYIHYRGWGGTNMPGLSCFVSVS